MTDTETAQPVSQARSVARMLTYPLMIAITLGVVGVVRMAGADLVAPARGSTVLATPASTVSGTNTVLHVLLALLVVIIAARLCGALCNRFHQPAVIGEVIAGILLGPSLLGRASPAAMQVVLPQTVAPYLSIIAQIGVILFMFLVGLQLDLGQLTGRWHSPLRTSASCCCWCGQS